MYSADEVVRAAKIISSLLPTLTQELLSNHRRELQIAFDRLEHVLHSGTTTSGATQQQVGEKALEYIHTEGPAHQLWSPSCSILKRPTQERPTQEHPEQPQKQPQEQPTQEQPTHEQLTQEQPQEQPQGQPIQEQPTREKPQGQPTQQQPTHEQSTQEQSTQEQPTQKQTAEELPVPDKPPQQPASRKDLSQEHYLSTIMKVLDQKSRTITSFTNKSEAKAVMYRENWTQLDPLEVDIQLSLRSCSLAQKFRAILARFIFADKYLGWAESTHKLPRVSFLLLDAKDADSKRKDSYISDYLDAINRSCAVNKRSVQHGLKMHSFEHIYGKPGTLAFLFYVHTHFRELKYSSLKHLAELIRKSSTWSKVAETSEKWVENCVLLYKKDCAEYRNQRCQKRPIDSEGLEESQSKRAELDFPTSAAQLDAAGVAQDASSGTDASIPPVAELNMSLDEMSSFQNDDLPNLAFSYLYNPFLSDFDFLLPLDGNEGYQPTDPGPESNFDSQGKGLEFPSSIS